MKSRSVLNLSQQDMTVCEDCGGHKPRKKKRNALRGMRTYKTVEDDDDFLVNEGPALDHPDQLWANIYAENKDTRNRHDDDDDDDGDERYSKRNSNVLEHPRMF